MFAPGTGSMPILRQAPAPNRGRRSGYRAGRRRRRTGRGRSSRNGAASSAHGDARKSVTVAAELVPAPRREVTRCCARQRVACDHCGVLSAALRQLPLTSRGKAGDRMADNTGGNTHDRMADSNQIRNSDEGNNHNWVRRNHDNCDETRRRNRWPLGRCWTYLVLLGSA